jgi:phenylalanyl-tRNA synthetase beta chain
MKISYNWLKDYIQLHESAEELAELLTSGGLEVEGIEEFENIKGGLKGIVIGEVITCAKHPNADKLSITTVDVGQDRPYPIVCGAPNVAAGQKVVVALPGATLYPISGEPFEIKKAKIRGEVSEGMICAEDEIGLGESHAGIMVLDTKLANGTAASEYFKVVSDKVFEIGLTPNRVDAASHIGVARDLKAKLSREIKWPDVSGFKAEEALNPIKITVENPEACPRYSGLCISEIKVQESPEWLKNRLLSIGLTPINNIVDITNYVLHETGQPLHAFDADHIAGKEVIVKTLTEGTPFITLDEKQRQLAGSDLMICDNNGGMCIAGIFGGIHSGIKSSTQNIFLESACFDAASIRKTAMKHQLKTDASFRFERGTDPEITIYALKRAAILIKEIAGGRISEITDVYPKPVNPAIIKVNEAYVNRLIGQAIPRKEVLAILDLLDIKVIDQTSSDYTLEVPAYRVDVKQAADIVEEIIRIYGLDNIEIPETTGTDFLSEHPERDINKFENTIRQLLTANGFYEVITNSLTSEAQYKRINIAQKGEAVLLANKLSEEIDRMRQNMLYSLLSVCEHNINRRQKDLKLFELGKTYHKMEDLYLEDKHLVILMTGNIRAESWQEKSKPLNFYDLQQQMNLVLQRLGKIDASLENYSDEFLEYGIKLKINDSVLATAGKVHASLLKYFDIKQEIFFADVDMDLLFKSTKHNIVFKELPKFPEVRRDLSLVIDKQVDFKSLEQLAKKSEKALIKKINVFDVYEGKNIPENKKAYALSFILQDENKTLTDEEIDGVMSKLMKRFEEDLGAVIRK